MENRGILREKHRLGLYFVHRKHWMKRNIIEYVI